MKRLLLAGIVLFAASWLLVAEPTPAVVKPIEVNGQTFTLPPGFEIELVAGPPLIERPIVADFDEQGRLYVADSSGSNDKVDKQLKERPHRIVRLEDTDGDGRFDRRTVFADKMMFPEGTMWLAGSLYVAAPPSIWKLTDTDGDGVADQRVEWFQGKTLTGCANDLHGPYRGPDGWIYWCKGAFAQQTYERPGKPPLVTKAAHIFRCRPDGTGIEPVMTGGMDNPVDVVFTPGGERIFTTTFFQHPGGGRRDGLVHGVYGGVYGKDHAVIYNHPWTSPTLLPVLTHLGAAAPCGLARYESSAFGPAYQDNLFACLFNMHKVTRHVLEPDGASFRTRDEDFVVSGNLDFHPTDVLEDADGSLLVLDTGGWYKLCCPTSQLVKPDILGGIYRIRRKGTPRPDDPRGLRLAWGQMTADDLAQRLDDPRPVVRRRAIETLAGQEAKALPVLAQTIRGGKSAETRRNAVWAATRIDGDEARAAIRPALADSDESVRQAAIHAVSVRRDREALRQLVELLRSPSLHNRRAAAEALGRLGERSAVSPLLDAIGALETTPPGGPPDRMLENSLTYALIEIADPRATAAGLDRANPLVRRAALTALDQMPGGGLEVSAVLHGLAAADGRLKETAWWIAGRHPEWGSAVLAYLREHLARAEDLPPVAREELAGRLARFAQGGAVGGLLSQQLSDPSTGRAAQRIVLQAMARANLKEAPSEWITVLTDVLGKGDTEMAAEAVATIRALRIPAGKRSKLDEALLTLGRNPRTPAALRVAALAAVPAGLPQVEPSLFDLLRSQLDPEQPVAVRAAAADVLARAKLTAEQLVALTESLKAIGPMDVDRLLEAFTRSTDDRVGLALLAALTTSPVRSSLRVEMVKPRLAKYSAKVQQQAEELYASLNVDAARQQARLTELLAGLKDGDIRRGQIVFNSQKAACSSCHAIGYLGGTIGPDLTHIGKIRSERDLLESIIAPSVSFVRSYEPVQVTTKAGKVHNGLIRKDAPDEILLATNATEQVRIARTEIEEIQPGKVSVMPAGLDQQLTPGELADLVTFLKACK
jgi:putative membrane-bound dehydrogenase-like protein